MTSTPAAPPQRTGGWRQFVERWFIPYAMVGLTTGGLVAILLPLAAQAEASGPGGDPRDVGLVMASVSLGLLSAPGWGVLADRLHLHRVLFGAGAALAAAALLALSFDPPRLLWFALALLVGTGGAAVTTIANLFVVEAHPQPQWNERLGWLQMFYGGGLGLGLLVASPLSNEPVLDGLRLTAAVTAVAAVLCWLTTRNPPPAQHATPVVKLVTSPGDWTHAASRGRRVPLLEVVRSLRTALLSRFGLFLLVWVIANAGMAGVYSFYPLLMEDVFQIEPSQSSVAYSIAMGFGLLLYAPTGVASNRFGAVRVFQVSLLGRMVSVAALALLGAAASFPGRDWLAMLAFVPVTLAFSTLGVSSAAIASRLSPVGEGEGMGLYNASSGVTQLAGTAAAGLVVSHWGYNAVSVVAAAGLALGLALSLVLAPADVHGRVIRET